MEKEIVTILEAILKTKRTSSTDIKKLLEAMAIRSGKGIEATQGLEPLIKALIKSHQNGNRDRKEVLDEIKKLSEKKDPVGMPLMLDLNLVADKVLEMIPLPKDGKTPTKEEITDLIKPLIPEPVKGEQGEDGKTPTNEELENLIKPLIPKIRDGIDGETPIKGVDYFTEQDKEELELNILSQIEIPEKVILDTPKQFKEKVMALLKVDNIKGLNDVITSTVRRMGSGGSQTEQITQRVDLSAQCNGTVMTFTLPEKFVPNSVQLHSTQFPIVYRPIVDFVENSNQTQITLQSSQVNAPESGQTLVATYNKA